VQRRAEHRCPIGARVWRGLDGRAGIHQHLGSANPEAYDANTLAPATTFEVPSNVRSMSVQPGRIVLLTAHSIEVWSTAAPEREKRRSVR